MMLPRGYMTLIENTLEVWMAYNIGEKPGKGRYCCTKCGWSVALDDGDGRLPPCGNCGPGQSTTYTRC